MERLQVFLQEELEVLLRRTKLHRQAYTQRSIFCLVAMCGPLGHFE